ncbi:MAG: NAD(P)/FAD-dependent oxidoreductase [Oscillospiraceae bacterium]|nr:NAD(P)/FAD-dependent oxidoreductase [Oscillospiraceae bacterium]
MAAVTAASEGCPVTVVERNRAVGRKLLITGKGRCNVTNDLPVEGLVEGIVRNGRFMYPSLSGFGSGDIMRFFEDRGLPLERERGGRVFPASSSAADVAAVFVREMGRLGVRLIRGFRAASVRTEDAPGGAAGGRRRAVGIIGSDGAEIGSKAVVLATGGVTYPATGSTGDGHAMARALGHKVTELRPSLVPMESPDDWPPKLTGLTLKNVTLTMVDGSGRPAYKGMGELLFTHFGLSGPLVLSASCHMVGRGYAGAKAVIDLKPALDMGTLDARIVRDFRARPNAGLANALGGLLPSALVPIAIALSGLDPAMKANGVTRGERARIAGTLKGLTVNVSGPRPIDEAIVTSGGVDVREVDPSTMGSKVIDGLYIAGELLDVDAYTGGYNLTVAFSSGHSAGLAAARKAMGGSGVGGA